MQPKARPFALLLCVATSAGAALTACGRIAEDAAVPQIFGGTDVTTGPVLQSVVSLRIDGQFFCTGTLVANDLVVTAGHCNPYTTVETDAKKVRDRARTAAAAIQKMTVGFGADAKSPTATRPVVETSSHPDYVSFIATIDRVVEAVDGGRTPSNFDQIIIADRVENGGLRDIAVFKFKGGIPNGFKAVKVAAGAPAVGTDVNMAGFGISQVGRTDFGKLKSVANRLLALDKKELVIAHNGKGTCKGDSGGPVYATSGNEIELVGVNSRGSDPESCDAATARATDATSEIVWLQSAARAFGSALTVGTTGSTAPAPVVVLPPAPVVNCSLNNNKGRLLCESRKPCKYTPATGVCASGSLPTL
jgi:V8-like Glu-specific endopeptidase